MNANDWPWRITVTKTDGTVSTSDYTDSDDFHVIGFARHMSAQPNVTRVNVSTAFAAGEQISPDTV